MTTPFTRQLVSTRFSPPRIGARHVTRAELLAQLQRMQHCRLALVTGSAGYGKTTLLAQWRQACLKAGAEVGWLSLTSDDKGYVDFCTALFSAMQRSGLPVEMDLPPEGASAVAMDTSIAAIVEAAVDLPKDLYLFIDDYHYVEAPLAHKFLQKLLDHGPGNLHFVIASRTAPPLGLSRLRMMDQIVEVDSAGLPFDLAETRAFVDENLGPGKVNADELALIHELTGGWPSCIQLIVIMLKNRPQTRAVLDDLVWRSSDLQTYLSEEVMAHLPAGLAEFAEALSIFRRFNASLARFVTGDPNADELLRRMEDENLLLIRVDLDDRLSWFRFHPLFGEFLATRLARREPGAVRELHRRASQRFAEHGFLAEAVRHASAAEDVEFAASVIERAAPATWSLEYLSPMLHLLEQLPEETLLRHPRLLFFACLAVAMTTRPAKASAWLAQLEASDLTAHPEIARSLPIIHAAIAFQHDDTQRMIELLEPHRDAPLENPFLQYMLVSELCAAYNAAGRYADARRLFETQPIPPADENNDMALVAQATLVSGMLIEGNALETEHFGAAPLTRSVHAVGRHSISANICASVLADAYYELDRIDDARETIANRRGLLQSSGPDMLIRASLCRVRLDLLQESPDVALAFLQRQIAHLRSMRQMRAVAHLLAEQVKMLLLKRDRARAQEALDSLDNLALSQPARQGVMGEIPALAALARARVLHDESPEEALRALQAARSHADAFGRGRLTAQTDLLSAVVYTDLKRTDDAIVCLVRAIEAGQRLGLVRTFVDEGAPAGKLIARMMREKRLGGPALRYAAELIEKFPESVVAEGPASSTRRVSASKLQPMLTPREVEILGLVAQAMSNKRIALALNITLETVKWNLRNIFAKLGVSSRYDAMVWARKQELIE
ncbi:LuxR C-terminal-related transcriptional regulator [Caballeronia grimmiae]|uniref:GerE family transcriptional regulator n=1 Tax=Caballeronia grimmiae TaxID=1071679 RepID=A0A069PHX7_9BURK|nr:LuxR C-terminal-related transcriptional regulator [Caballeronia grimmiae]KDR36961.1 LuxR family transcriptional regulator [Caballeronia grimmiae]GGD75905.1 GerE family transcriptional regulator [Caballeronia grimmiae]